MLETNEIFGNVSKEAEVKTASKTEPKKTTRKTTKTAAKAETSKVEAKTETKAVAKKTTAKKAVSKTETKTAAKAETKTTAKKTAARKTAAKKDFKKELFFQYNNNQVDEDTLVSRVVADCKAQNVEIKDLKLYLKPEDNACYYVANGNVAGRVDLY